MLATDLTSTAPADHLWRAVAEVTAWPDVLPTFTSVTPLGSNGRLQTGSRYRVRQPGLAPAIYEVTDCTPDGSFTWVARSPGIVTVATHTVTAEGRGSRLRLTLEWAGPLAPIVRALLSRKAQRMIDLEAATLAGLAEASAGAGG